MYAGRHFDGNYQYHAYFCSCHDRTLGYVTRRCFEWSDVGNSMNIPVIMLIVASLSLGTALEITGGSDFIANWFVYFTASFPMPVILSVLMLLMALLTNVVSNNAAAVLGTPVAINIAIQLGAPIEPFGSLFCSVLMSFCYAIGYKTLLIMGAGGYTFNDFVNWVCACLYHVDCIIDYTADVIFLKKLSS